MAEGTLSQRGWTLQEITLSPRVLWLGAWEMAWRCACATACECHPELSSAKMANIADSYKRWELPRVEMSQSGSKASDADDSVEVGYGHQEVLKRADAAQACLAMWHEILPLYSKRKLTDPGERLPAAAGLAGILMRRLNCRYLSGLWEVALKRQLLWQNSTRFDDNGHEIHYGPAPDNNSENGRWSKDYAPSWS